MTSSACGAGRQSASSGSEGGTNLAPPFVAILVLKASTFEVAALAVVDTLPFVLFSLPAGVWVDRLRRRPILIAADWGRALALGSIPVAFAAGALTLVQLYLVGFVAGTLTVFFDVSYQSYLTRKLHKRLHTHRTLRHEQVGLNTKAPTCGDFAEPSDGLEPSTPSLPWRCSTN